MRVESFSPVCLVALNVALSFFSLTRLANHLLYCPTSVKLTSSKQPDPSGKLNTPEALAADQIHSAVEKVLATTQFIDMHTHLFPPAFGKLGLWGIDELLTYHYLEAEFFRFSDMTPEQYWSLAKARSGRRDLASSVRREQSCFRSDARNYRGAAGVWAAHRAVLI